MNKIEKITLGISSLLMGIILSRFAISKLAGWQISVDAFIEMAQPLGINPTLFRVFTGVLILVVFVSYLLIALSTFLRNEMLLYSQQNYYNFGLFANVLGLGTMVGALLAEFFLRIQPKMPLVYIAIGIIIFSVINLRIILKKHTPSIKVFN